MLSLKYINWTITSLEGTELFHCMYPKITRQHERVEADNREEGYKQK